MCESIDVNLSLIGFPLRHLTLHSVGKSEAEADRIPDFADHGNIGLLNDNRLLRRLPTRLEVNPGTPHAGAKDKDMIRLLAPEISTV